MSVEMAHQRQTDVDVVPVTNGSQTGDAARGSVHSVGPQDLQADVADPRQSGDSVSSVGLQDLQMTRLVIDIGDNKTIEITLMGNILLQQNTGTPPAASGAPGNAAAPQGHATTQQADDDRDFLHQMRGWLMTVAALFVGMAFQAVIQPPTWIPKDWFQVLLDTKFGRRGSRTWTMPAPSPSPSVAEVVTITGGQATRVLGFLIFNAVTFGTGLTLLLMLLMMKKSPPTRALRLATLTVVIMATSAALTFLYGVSYDLRVSPIISAVMMLYGFFTAHMIRHPSQSLIQ